MKIVQQGSPGFLFVLLQRTNLVHFGVLQFANPRLLPDIVPGREMRHVLTEAILNLTALLLHFLPL